MKILIVSKCQTHPTTAGNRRFILNQVQLFCRMGHEVHFLYIQEKALSAKNRENNDEIELMKRYWGNNIHVYCVSKLEKLWFNVLRKVIRPYFNDCFAKVDDVYPNGLTRYVAEINREFHFDCLIVNYYYLSKLLQNSNIPLKGITTHDYFCYKDLLVGARNVLNNTDAHQEAKAMQRSPHIFSLNTEEAILFSKLSPLSQVYNVFSSYDYHPSHTIGNKVMLLLSGPNQYNLNGLRWFVDKILPTIIERNPGAKLRIGGLICDMVPDYISNPNIELFGLVDDQSSFYGGADVVINPTYQGTGLKIKTFESVSYDKITIVHPHSMTGIYKPAEAPIYASTNAEDWANYLYKVWNEKNFIENIKVRNKKYLLDMQIFIESEYKRFFNSINYNN